MSNRSTFTLWYDIYDYFIRSCIIKTWHVHITLLHANPIHLFIFYFFLFSTVLLCTIRYFMVLYILSITDRCLYPKLKTLTLVLLYFFLLLLFFLHFSAVDNMWLEKKIFRCLANVMISFIELATRSQCIR